MRIGSLFSGAGGLDMAVENVFGGEVIWQSEYDKAASKVLAYRFPCAPNLGDITQIDWKTVETPDVLCGGWPCQPFSLAGKRKGINDDRALWPFVAGAIRALRPRYVVLENVSAVLTAGEFDRVAADLAQAGYVFAWTCLRASDVGAPHQRERLFVLAHTAGDGWDEGRPESAGFVGRSDAALGGDESVALLPTPTTQDGSNTAGPSQFDRNSQPLNVVATLLPTPNASDGSGGGPHPDKREGHSQQLIDSVLAPEQWGKYAPAIHRWEQIAGPAPSPTEPNRNGKPRLKPEFSSWMMGWPAGWVTDPDIGISRNDQLKIVGNGVCPQQALAALRLLLDVSEVAA